MDWKLTEKEVKWVIIAIILFEFIVIFPNKISNLFALLVPPIIILVTIFTKKIAGDFFNIKIEHKIWHLQQYGWYRRTKYKKPLPFGILIPFITTLVTFGLIKPMALLQFDFENMKERRILRQIGEKRRRKDEVNESDYAFTAAGGFLSLLVLAIIGILIRFPELTKYSIYYGLWNLVPASQLDGSRLFFGSLISWLIIVILFILFIPFLLVY